MVLRDLCDCRNNSITRYAYRTPRSPIPPPQSRYSPLKRSIHRTKHTHPSPLVRVSLCFSIPFSVSSTQNTRSFRVLHPHPPTHAPSTRSIRLHLLAHLNIHLEELGYAAVQADRLPLIEVRLAVIGREAFAGACGLEAVSARVC